MSKGKAIHFKPRTLSQAKAFVAITEAHGYSKVFNASDPDWLREVREGKKHLCVKLDGRGILRTGIIHNDELVVQTLDALVDALSSEVKEPKQINTLAVINGRCPASDVEVILTPTGGVKVQCHEFPKESFERIHREWLEYNKAE